MVQSCFCRLSRQSNSFHSPHHDKHHEQTQEENPEIIYNMMRYGVHYQKKTVATFVDDHRVQLKKNLYCRAKEMGYELKKIEQKVEEVSS